MRHSIQVREILTICDAQAGYWRKVGHLPRVDFTPTFCCGCFSSLFTAHPAEPISNCPLVLSWYAYVGLKAAEVVELCQGAQNIGPAQCFVQSRGLGTTAERTHLCNGAFSAVCLCAGHHCIVERSRCALSPFS
jgi:hypothetical protein